MEMVSTTLILTYTVLPWFETWIEVRLITLDYSDKGGHMHLDHRA